MKRAQFRDAVLNEKFHFRSKLATCHTPTEPKKCGGIGRVPEFETSEMSVDQIINGLSSDLLKVIYLSN